MGIRTQIPICVQNDTSRYGRLIHSSMSAKVVEKGIVCVEIRAFKEHCLDVVREHRLLCTDGYVISMDGLLGSHNGVRDIGCICQVRT